jgi:hypothetical protein
MRSNTAMSDVCFSSQISRDYPVKRLNVVISNSYQRHDTRTMHDDTDRPKFIHGFLKETLYISTSATIATSACTQMPVYHRTQFRLRLFPLSQHYRNNAPQLQGHLGLAELQRHV